ncbi:DUF1365 domain-containing protein [Herbaspirillum sp. RTI4]|uniref:DUF1365 domain-containing protein n=1 Tax=Herbaspirillum sp. RTI4 TaxID=3048640 RepID=UPI002AB41A39|nr:DUF1365 domain-containing protein [Herbaspirillum sp. RTI4]MDY7579480.1 DUF1365 domain-containing protein [Herbaspirillum sp. RTI4]MEA9980394.1 DUF1365 domain-containing protein [Herbaspirillum sp. RTI4]
MSSSSARPLICFGQVRHTRLRPVQHAFNYGVYYLRLPLRALGQNDFGSRLLSRNRFNLLSFHDRDYGDGVQTPLEWIDGLLQREGITDADGEIWLQTFPRVLGYVFNPVSFWFCHRSDGALRAVLCAVSNTFGERHCYLLEDPATLAWGEELQTEKIFHVSPFFKVEGRYRFRFLQTSDQDPQDDAPRHVARIDYDDDEGELLHTSLSGRAYPVNERRLLRAFFAYPLMSFGVMFRIHWQALKLWRKRVPFFRKPIPPASKVTR